MSKVEILQDDECEMLKIKVNGIHFFEGNYWDFNLLLDLPSLLKQLDIEVIEKEYSYE